MKELDDKFFDQLLKESLAEHTPKISNDFTFDVMAEVTQVHEKQLRQVEKYAFWKEFGLGIGFLFVTLLALFALQYFKVIELQFNPKLPSVELPLLSSLVKAKYFNLIAMISLSVSLLFGAERLLKKKLKI